MTCKLTLFTCQLIIYWNKINKLIQNRKENDKFLENCRKTREIHINLDGFQHLGVWQIPRILHLYWNASHHPHPHHHHQYRTPCLGFGVVAPPSTQGNLGIEMIAKYRWMNGSYSKKKKKKTSVKNRSRGMRRCNCI